MDNEGEGGVLALMALLSRKPGRRFMLFIGMFGAALVYGDCALTPAISVLSALEGLHVIAPELDRFVLPGDRRCEIGSATAMTTIAMYPNNDTLGERLQAVCRRELP